MSDRVVKASALKTFEHEIHSHLKIISPKQMIQRLPIALVQVKAGNTSENLLNEIRQIIYSLYLAKKKKKTKKVCNNIMSSIKFSKIMDNIFMHSRNSKTSNSHSLLLNLSDKINLSELINMLLYQILALPIHEKM